MKKFLNGKILSFSIRQYPNNEWIAECNEIPAIMTGGIDNDISNMDFLIRDAILTAAGVDTKYSNNILKFVGYKSPINTKHIKSPLQISRKAEYVIS